LTEATSYVKGKVNWKKTTSNKNVIQQIRIRNLSVAPEDKYNICYKS